MKPPRSRPRRSGSSGIGGAGGKSSDGGNRSNKSSGGSGKSGGDRTLLVLLAFALTVFATTVCLLAAGLAARADEASRLGGFTGAGADGLNLEASMAFDPAVSVVAGGARRAMGGSTNLRPAAGAASAAGGSTAAVSTDAAATDAAPAAVGAGGSSSGGAAGGNAVGNPAGVAGKPHLDPPVPYLPPHTAVPNQQPLIADTLSGAKPTIAGIHAILQNFLLALHKSNMNFHSKDAVGETNGDGLRDKAIKAYFQLATEHLVPLDAAYRGRSVFPVRTDDSIFMSLASYRDYLLGETLKEAFRKAAHPDKLFVGAVVQNCFGDEWKCKTGVEVVGKDAGGHPMTKVSDAPPDRNGVAEFCQDENYKKYCQAGQVRALYVNETESLGPAVARYWASKLWGGETYYVQADAHLRFAPRWDQRYVDEVKAAKAYPKAVLSSYPPGFSESDPDYVGGTRGARLCTCEFSASDVEDHIIRINTGAHCTNDDVKGPTQIPFIAAGFFFARAEFLTDVPFDPFLPWCFMGEEIALSIRAWTAGWDIYAPRENLIAHQYRPGRMGLPKFWELVGRVFNRPGPGFNTRLQKVVIKRVKHMVGYPENSREAVVGGGDEIVLTEMEHYGLGTVRPREEYIKLTNIDFENKKCRNMPWCNRCELT